MTFNHLKIRFLGFGILSGIPFYVILSTLSFYLSEHNFNPHEIGQFAIITVPYSLKFIWSPILDTFITKQPYSRFQIFKFFGFIFSILTGLCHIGIGIFEPLQSFFAMAILGLLTCFFASLQDLLIDALRLEYFHQKQQTEYIVMQTIGFRSGLLLGSAGVIYTAAYFGWSKAFIYFGFFHLFLSCIFLTLHFKDAHPSQEIKISEKMSPIKERLEDFKKLNMNKKFMYTILFVLFFKMGDICTQSMLTPLLFEYGYTKIAFANLTKTYGIPMMILGTLLLPPLLKKVDFNKLILIVLILQLGSTLSLLFFIGFKNSQLIHLIIIGLTSLISGLTAATFISITSELCVHPFKTTQFNIFSTASAFSRVVISSFSGFIAFYLGWTILFLTMSFLLMIFIIIFMYNNNKILPFNKNNKNQNIVQGPLHVAKN